MTLSLDEMALEYHRYPTPGKLKIEPTKRMTNQRDLALAYSPGVAAACRAIVADPLEAANLTARGNLVAVISNGTAVLGLGAIGPLASKPVMEGKAVLFKKFAGIDVFDIEVDERDPDKLVEIVVALEPTFGGINLEDIKSPECFIVEQKCRERMKIPVFHDDQHGTAICVGAAILNGLELAGKSLGSVRIVCSGAGAAALACLDLLVAQGADKANIIVADIDGIVYAGREIGMDPYKARYAADTSVRTLGEALEGADVFLGLSAPRIVKPEWVARMAARPLVLALANPDPEIRPEDVKSVRDDAIIATGRSDYPNQVNNVLCFPFIFRGALDVGATTINEAMKIAAVRAIAELTRAEPSDVVARAYGDEELRFGPEYILPKPFDPRLILWIAPAVAEAAMASGVATRPIADIGAYQRGLAKLVYRSGQIMEPIFRAAAREKQRIVYAEGEDARVLRAVQLVLDEGLVEPIVVGRRSVIAQEIRALGLRFQLDRDVRLVDPTADQQHTAHAQLYHRLAARNGVSPANADLAVRTRTTVLGAVLVAAGEADGLLCGVAEPFHDHFKHLKDIIGLEPGVAEAAALRLIVLKEGFLFITDTAVSYDPSAEQLATVTELAARAIRGFGFEPRVALVSHSDFGSHPNPSAVKMRMVYDLLTRRGVDFPFDGEMGPEAALIPEIRHQIIPESTLKGRANLLVMPNLDAAKIAYNLCWSANDGLGVGPILLGMAKSVHVLANNVTVRGLVNMTALAAVGAQVRAVRATAAPAD